MLFLILLLELVNIFIFIFSYLKHIFIAHTDQSIIILYFSHCIYTLSTVYTVPGSILVACAHHGGYVLGADIDKNLIHGRGVCVRVMAVMS